MKSTGLAICNFKPRKRTDKNLQNRRYLHGKPQRVEVKLVLPRKIHGLGGTQYIFRQEYQP